MVNCKECERFVESFKQLYQNLSVIIEESWQSSADIWNRDMWKVYKKWQQLSLYLW